MHFIICFCMSMDDTIVVSLLYVFRDKAIVLRNRKLKFHVYWVNVLHICSLFSSLVFPFSDCWAIFQKVIPLSDNLWSVSISMSILCVWECSRMAYSDQIGTDRFGFNRSMHTGAFLLCVLIFMDRWINNIRRIFPIV